MTIDEAIKHCEEVVAECATECKAGHISQRIKAGKCAEDHRQLAKWLKDLKRFYEYDLMIVDGKVYVAYNPKVKTIHEKTGEVVIGGFREVDG